MWIRRDTPQWQRRLDAALRKTRPSPPESLVHQITERLSTDAARPRVPWSRLAFATAFAVFIVGTFASLGGLGYARPGAVGTYEAVKQIVVAHKLKVTVQTPSAAAQYPKPPKKKPPVFKPPERHAVHAANKIAGRTGGTLPFTGLSLLGTLVLSVALIGLGIVLRRRERRS
jgi:hypothetical protein